MRIAATVAVVVFGAIAWIAITAGLSFVAGALWDMSAHAHGNGETNALLTVMTMTAMAALATGLFGWVAPVYLADRILRP